MNLPDPDGVVWIDGEPMPARQAGAGTGDPTLLGGWGLFETFAVRGGAVLDLGEHLSRLAVGAATLGFKAPAPEQLEAALFAAVEAPNHEHGWVKLVLAGSGRTIVFSGSSDPEREGRPCTAVILRWRRNRYDPLASVKSTSYAENLFALREARIRGADEGLWLGPRGHLAEGCASNLFVVRRGRLFTPALSEGILPGVVRGKTIEAARRLGVAVHDGKLRRRRLNEADEAFLTSSLRGVAPLVQIDGRRLAGGEPGPLTRRISREVEALRIGSRGGDRVSPGRAPRDGSRRSPDGSTE